MYNISSVFTTKCERGDSYDEAARYYDIFRGGFRSYGGCAFCAKILKRGCNCTTLQFFDFESEMLIMKKVAIIMGSDSDFPVVKNAAITLKSFGVEYECHVMSAHRSPELAAGFAKNAKANGFGVIICAAGMAAHLAGVVAGHTTLPVIGIPCKGANLDGLDALLATVQMPSGIPVATVAVDGAKNAAILAVQMLALSDEGLAEKLEAEKAKMLEGVIAKDKAMQEKIGEL